MALDYTTYVSQLATETAIDQANSSFATILPACIDFAEQRIYRELNLLDTVVVDDSVTTTAGTRTITISSDYYVTNALSVFTPAGADASTGTRVTLIPVSKEVLDLAWPSAASAYRATPQMFAMKDQFTAILGPCPDATYTVETTGTQRPAPLSSTNTTTFLTTYLPDLFFAASMAFMGSYMRNQEMERDWEDKYQVLRASADIEEARKHGWAASWTAFPVSPAAQPQRG